MRITPKTLMLKTACACDAGVVDQDVDAPELFDHLFDRGGGRGVTGHVEVEERDPAQQGGPGGVAAGADHVETLFDEREGGLFPDAGRGACHEGHRPSCRHHELPNS
jgi:hypothetical protein